MPALAGVKVAVTMPRPRFGIWTLTPSPLMRKPWVVSSLVSTISSVVPTATLISDGWKAKRSAVTSTVCSAAAGGAGDCADETAARLASDRTPASI